MVCDDEDRAGDNGPAFSKMAVISVENISYSNHLDDRDQLKQALGDVRLKGIMGSHHHAHTNFERRPRLTGARRGPAQGGRQSGWIRWDFGWLFDRLVTAVGNQRSRQRSVVSHRQAKIALYQAIWGRARQRAVNR